MYLFQGKSADGTGWSVIKIAVKAGTAKHMATGRGDWFIKQPKWQKQDIITDHEWSKLLL